MRLQVDDDAVLWKPEIEPAYERHRDAGQFDLDAVLARPLCGPRNAILPQLLECDGNRGRDPGTFLFNCWIGRECGQRIEPRKRRPLAFFNAPRGVEQSELDTCFHGRASMCRGADTGLAPHQLLQGPHRRLSDKKVDRRGG